MDPELHQSIFRIHDQKTFRETALKVFYYQARHCRVYREYLAGLDINPESVSEIEGIPFLPVEFFKSHTVLTEGMNAEEVFESSGTSRLIPARHHIAELSLYRSSFTKGFTRLYGAPDHYCMLALLPSYLERSGSSLVYMMDHLIGQSEHPDSGFYLDNLSQLAEVLLWRTTDKLPTLLMGVSFALLDLAEQHPMNLGQNIIVMETGGMKGRRKELVRNELHDKLTASFGIPAIHSEYGMTELLSQAYSSGKGIFSAPPWMRVLARDPNDPLSLISQGKTGGLNIIDLANLHSCSFIATGDLGKVFEDGSFEVLGRYDHSDIRGCNLLVT